ncbi:conserved Plasmodium protein, unknown function [Plasmodium sp. DRC-Itaito]|nr:conserved Plasmodium protein, unknown function [Plasmodium sp. DRC-Itaito]
MNDFSEEYDFMQRIHKVEGYNEYNMNKGLEGNKDDDLLYGKDKCEKEFYLKSKYDKYSNVLNGFGKDDKYSYLKKLKNEKEYRKRSEGPSFGRAVVDYDSKKSNINELTKIHEIVYYIHANKRNVYDYLNKQTDLENNYYQIEEKPQNLTNDIVRENEEYIYLNENAYYKLKINKEDKDDAGGGAGGGGGRNYNDGGIHNIGNMKIRYTVDDNGNNIMGDIIEGDNFLLNIANSLFTFKDYIKNVIYFLSKIFHYNFLDYTYIKNYSLTNYFDKNVKDYMKYLKKSEDTRFLSQEFILRKKFITPHFIYNCVDCNYNTNDNGIIILSSIYPFMHSYDYNQKLKDLRNQENELDNILNNERKRRRKTIFSFVNKFRNFVVNKIYSDKSNVNNMNSRIRNQSEYSEFLKKFESSINEEGELIQDIIFPGKAQMIFINFKQLENNFTNMISNVEVKNEKVQVSSLILGYEKKEHIKYTDILISNILKNIKKKYPDMVINDENPVNFLLEQKDSIPRKLSAESGNDFKNNINKNHNSNNNNNNYNNNNYYGDNISYHNNSVKNNMHNFMPSTNTSSYTNKNFLSSEMSSDIYFNKKDLYKLSDLKDYIYNSPSHLMKEKKSSCEYVTCVCFDNNSNNCNLINNFVLGYNTGKLEYIYGKIIYSNISHCDLLIDYYSKKNKKFSYELNKRIYLNGSVIKISFAPNGFFCLILTSRTLYLCNFFYFSIYEITNNCYNSQYVNFLWLNNNSYVIFNGKGHIHLYEKNLKSDGFQGFSVVKTFFINQEIFFNSICEYHLYSNSIYLYTGEIEKKRRKKCSGHLFKKNNINNNNNKNIRKKRTSEYFYKYDCNLIIIDLNSDIHKNISNYKGKEFLNMYLKDNMNDIDNNMKEIKMLEKLIDNANTFEDEDIPFDKLTYINIKDFNNYISTIKTFGNNLYMNNESGDEHILEYDPTKSDENFSLKKLFVNYIKDVKRYLYNLKNDNIVNILLPRYYSSSDDYNYNNFLNIRFFTIEKSDNKHLIALDTETDFVYIYKIRKNVYLDDDTLDNLKNRRLVGGIGSGFHFNNPLQMFYSTYMKKESLLKDEWRIYNDYIYINTKKPQKFIKYNLLYIIKNQRKIFFPLHVYVINTKRNENEYFLFIKWATIKNSFIYSSYSSLNKVSKMKEYFKRDDEKLLKVLENPKNIFLYNINENDYPDSYLYNNNSSNRNNINNNRLLNRRNKLIDKDYLSENDENYILGNKYKDKLNKQHEPYRHSYRQHLGPEDYMNKTPMKNIPPRNFFTTPVSPNNLNMNNIHMMNNNNNTYNIDNPGRYSDNDLYHNNTAFYMNNKAHPTYQNYLQEKKNNEEDSKWSYFKKMNIFRRDNKSDMDDFHDADEDYYNRQRAMYNSDNDPRYRSNKNRNNLNMEQDHILNDMRSPHFYSTSNHMRYNRLQDGTDGSSTIENNDINNMNHIDFVNDINNNPKNNYDNNYSKYDSYKNIRLDINNTDNINNNNNNANTTYNNKNIMNNDMYQISSDLSSYLNDIEKTNNNIGYIYKNNKDLNNVDYMYNEKDKYKNDNQKDMTSTYRKYI